MTFADLQRKPTHETEAVPHTVSVRYRTKSIWDQVMEQLPPVPDGYRLKLISAETIEEINQRQIAFFLEYKQGRYWGHQLNCEGKLVQPVIVPV